MRRRIGKKSSYSRTFYNNLTKFLWREVFNFLSSLFYPLLWMWKKSIRRLIFQLRTNGKNKNLDCPVRGPLATQVYDSAGVFTEEYHRVEITKRLLKRGFCHYYMNFHHKIQIGHGGRNSLIPDLVVRNKSREGYFLVLEVKKDPSKMKEALLYQLNPGMKILNARYGIYYDGSKKSSCFRHNGSRVGGFNFPEIPAWFYSEWRYS